MTWDDVRRRWSRRATGSIADPTSASSFFAAPAARRSSPAPTSRSSRPFANADDGDRLRSGRIDVSSIGSSASPSRRSRRSRASRPAAAAPSRSRATCASRRRLDVRHSDRPHAGQLSLGRQLRRLRRSDGPARAKDLLFTGRLSWRRRSARARPRQPRRAEGDDRSRGDGLARRDRRECAADDPRDQGNDPAPARDAPAGGRRDADLVEMCYMSADFREGVTAFLAKRKPHWSGK